MIDYSLAWLESAGVEEVFVFCCAHSKQVINYIENSQWLSLPKFSVTTIESHDSVSAGDALRLIYERNVIHGDFVLISGDTVSNMCLTQALQEHKERKKKDSNAIMTMVIKKSKPSPLTHQTRLGTDELFIAINPDTKQLMYYEDKADDSKGMIALEKALLIDNPSMSVHNDKQDCYIDICSPEVLSLFTDNFDYQHLRRHFVKGLLVDDIMGYKIFTHEIHSSYAARVDNFRSYDTISKDILQRWTYPLVPDVQFSGNCPIKLERQGMYRASDIGLSRSAQLGPFTFVGSGTSIGDYSKISNSVIGEGCSIGSNVSIEGSYIWNNVTIQDDCKLSHAIVCEGVVIKSGAVLEPGVVLSFKVVVGPQFIVPAYSKVSLLPQPTKQDSDEELEYADSSSGILESTCKVLMLYILNLFSWFIVLVGCFLVGVSGVGYIWSICEGGHEEEWKHSIAPIPADKLQELIKPTHPDPGSPTIPHPQPRPDSDSDSEDADNENLRDESFYFEREVEATFLRAVHEGVEQDHVILEVNSLRLSYNMASADCAGAIFSSVMKLAFETPHGTNGELLRNTASVITTWRDILRHYLQSIDEEIEVIMKFEEMCLESTKEFAPLFAQILHLLYDKDILTEDAIVSWASEKEGADESDKIFVKQSEAFIQENSLPDPSPMFLMNIQNLSQQNGGIRQQYI
ncbi:Bacterial transferase hexapeptide repeat [Macleaya cordata]|uniref:Translation initiation factor eIF2B subunit epsilon n=1 Tax=Macleaya cordata TaxID=56857 RepID=A0A200R8R3_MACCD|nr:Bacterial transferase hexapeptide repeat [Macleaya cordata]